MNFYPETSMGLRPNHASLSDLHLNSPTNSQRPRLPPHIGEELYHSSPSENSLINSGNGNSSSPSRQKLSLPSFLPSPSRLIQQLPASPASLLLSPLIKKSNTEQQLTNSPSFLLNNDDETNLIEHVDHYFLRRQQYLQHNIDISSNISRWVLENLVFYSVETLRFDTKKRNLILINYFY